MVGIVYGSDSHLPKIHDSLRFLEEQGVLFDVVVSSAHRTPDRMREWASRVDSCGIKLFRLVFGVYIYSKGSGA